MRYGKKPKGIKLIIKSENEQIYNKEIYLLRKKARQENFCYGEPKADTIGQLDELGWHTAYSKDEVKIWRRKR